MNDTKQEIAPDPHPHEPGFTVPAGACDAHFHIFLDPADYPLVNNPRFKPVIATNAQFQNMSKALHIERAVLVQPTVYGTDNRLLVRMLEENPDYRGIAVIDQNTPRAELQRLDRAGCRGIRMSGMPPGPAAHDYLRDMAKMAADVGWHIQIYAGPGTLMKVAETLASLPTDVVLDHFAGLVPMHAHDCPERRVLAALLETGRTWVKISGAYRSSKSGPPYEDTIPLARWLIQKAPDRIVWGSDWPHPHLNGGAMPNDGDLLNLFALQAESEGMRKKILVDNPTALYRWHYPA